MYIGIESTKASHNPVHIWWGVMQPSYLVGIGVREGVYIILSKLHNRLSFHLLGQVLPYVVSHAFLHIGIIHTVLFYIYSILKSRYIQGYQIILPANTWTFIHFRFYIYNKYSIFIDMLYSVFACSVMAQRKDVIIPGGPYGNGTISFNRVSKRSKYDYSK